MLMETEYINLIYNGKEESVLKYLSESKFQYNLRLEYIGKLEKSNVDFKEALRLSKIWYCIKFKKCKYHPEIYHKVMSYEK